MTAILSAYVPSQGFVIGADGRQRDTLDPTKFAEDTTKIFFFEKPGVKMAYAWAGITAFDQFNLLSISEQIWRAQRFENDISAFVSGFANEAYNRLLSELRNDPDVSNFKLISDNFCKLLVVGYFNDVPYRVRVEINAPNGRLVPQPRVLQRPKLSPPLAVSKPEFFAFNFPLELLCTGDLLSGPKPTSIKNAADTIRKNIQEAVDNEDDEDCKTVGGIIRIASVTPAGCDWISARKSTI